MDLYLTLHRGRAAFRVLWLGLPSAIVPRKATMTLPDPAPRAPAAHPVPSRRVACGAAGLILVLVTFPARPDCRLEIELMGSDLHGVPLTEGQKLELAPLVDAAQKHCRIGREAEAVDYIERARRVAGITRRPDDLEDDEPPR